VHALLLQLSLSCEAVREQRFREMESLDSLLALVPAGYAEAAAAEAEAVAASIRSNSKASERSRKQVHMCCCLCHSISSGRSMHKLTHLEYAFWERCLSNGHAPAWRRSGVQG
jgi:hypothetical protein